VENSWSKSRSESSVIKSYEICPDQTQVVGRPGKYNKRQPRLQRKSKVPQMIKPLTLEIPENDF
jgi:hypothetical protein